VFDKLILTDCDGVLLNWEYAFDVWMNDLGYNLDEPMLYNISDRYNVTRERANELTSFLTSQHLWVLFLL